VALSVGPEGGFYVGGADHHTNDADDTTVLSFARGPVGQPGVRCCWSIAAHGDLIAWDGCEKFSNGAEWLQYLVTTFVQRWGYTLEGAVRWRGEDDATGTLSASAHKVSNVPDQPEMPIDEEVRSWIAGLKEGDVDMRIAAATQLGCAEYASMASKYAAIEALANALDRPEVATKALETLGGFGELAASVTDCVVMALGSPNPMVRYWATFALGRMGPAARAALPALERLTKDAEAGPRYGAIDAIKRLS
jgi:hypothetical protein